MRTFVFFVGFDQANFIPTCYKTDEQKQGSYEDHRLWEPRASDYSLAELLSFGSGL